MLPQAKALAQSGRLKEADQLFDRLIAAKPRNAVVLAEAVQFQNRYARQFPKAMTLAGQLVALKPKVAQSHVLAAESALNCQRLRAASQHAQNALALAPKDPDALFIASAVDMARGQYDTALARIDAALAAQPGHLPAQIQRARALQAAGQMAEAEALVRDLLDTHPDTANLLPLLFGVATLTPDDPQLARLRDTVLPELRKVGGPPYADALRLLAKAQTDIGDHDAAFQTVTEAKSAAPMRRDAAGYADFVETICTRIDRALIDRDAGRPSDRPVLIVGMPRSGSTLLEQMLAMHPKVGSVGESPALRIITQDLRMQRHHGQHMLEAIRDMPQSVAAKMADRYLEETAAQDAGAARVIDKSLHNFELLGFFGRLLPQARIIHMLRDPLDTCVSCYLQPLSAWHSYTQTLADLGRAYMQHRQLMDHWAEVLPNPILTLRYEDLVAAPEATLRKATDFLDLAWDPACLDYQHSGNRSRTLSAGQVRKPLYQSSIRRWQNYEKHLGPLQAELRPLYPDGWTMAYR